MAVALHRVQFKWADGFGLDLEWTKGRGALSSGLDLPIEVVRAETEAELDLAAKQGIPAICYRHDSPVLFEPFQLRENTSYFADITVPLSREAAALARAEQPGWPFAQRIASVLQIDPVRRWRTDDEGKLVISGLLNLKNHAGILNLQAASGSGLQFEVVCQKVGYLDEFRVLLDRVAEELAELLLQYDSPVSAGFSISDVSSSHLAGLLFHLRRIMGRDNLPASMDEILGALHSKLISRPSRLDIEEVMEPDIEALSNDLDFSDLYSAGPLKRFFGGSTPRVVPVIEHYETVDTAENRYVKYFLEELLQLSTLLANTLGREGKAASAREASLWVEQIEELLSRRVWDAIGPFRQFPTNSQVLQKGRGYRDLLKHDLSLRMGLELPWKRAEELADGTSGDLRPVSELYEYWCFFVLRRAIGDVCLREERAKSTLVNVSSNGLRVALRKGSRSKICFIYRENPEARVEINLFYNRRFKRPNRSSDIWLGSYSASFHPDYSIEIVVTQSEVVRRHWLHFDAKYRLERADLESMFDDGSVASDDKVEDATYEQELKRVHKQDDLFKMHTYRDGILGSRGAYILYPGDSEDVRTKGKAQNIFVRHPSAFGGKPVQRSPSIGAFGLAPKLEPGQRAAISAFLKDTIDGLCTKGLGYIEETGMSDV